MRAKVLVLGLACLFLFSCEAFIFHRVHYNIALSEVERPAEAKERYGEYKISEMEPTEEKGFTYVFEDEMIKILWLPTGVMLGFQITNKTDHSIKIIWDEAAYVDENGESHRVMHGGVKYVDKEAPQPPSVVVRRGTLSDLILPTDYVSYTSGTYGGWNERPLLPSEQMGGDPQTLLRSARKFVGKTIQVLLPIQIETVTNDYIFSFVVEDVELVKKK